MKIPACFLILPVALWIAGCGSNKSGPNISKPDSVAISETLTIDKETELLIKDLADNGDYVNSREFPALIKASVVHENLGNNMHIIDLRSPQIYAQGHIKGSVNKRFEDLPSYFETGIKPFEYDKIVLVCEDGQISSYTASLLRLMGYGNVYAMRWGMSSWNKSIAEKSWLKGLSANHESELEKTANERLPAQTMPLLNTGLTSGAEISASRFRHLFEAGSGNILITADEVFNNPQQYYIINYERKDKYDDAHIPGAVRYKPNATLGFPSEMASIPTDKTVVVYCGTGHNSGFATAYLRLMGYDARTLQYGNNGFMHDWMVKDSAKLSWLPFSEADINNFEVVR
jgi:rhodanese-related sulfurtransferase